MSAEVVETIMASKSCGRSPAQANACKPARAAIPSRRESGHPTEGLYWQHVGIYAYTRPALATPVGTTS